MNSLQAAPPWDAIPALGREHLLDARLYADRWHMIEAIGPDKLACVAELGVALGDFSKALIARYDPDVFYAIDLFTLHDYAQLWGRPSSAIFQGRTHAEVYRERMQAHSARLEIRCGDGADELAKLPDGSIDLIYIDGSHAYENVVRDAAAAQRKVRPGGLLIFNDYVLCSPGENMWYGVVPVVNQLVASGRGKVIGLALHPDMYADIAIRM